MGGPADDLRLYRRVDGKVTVFHEDCGPGNSLVRVAGDGSLIVGKLDAEGNYRINRRSSDGVLQAVGPPIEFNRGWTAPVRALHRRNAVVFCGNPSVSSASRRARSASTISAIPPS